MPPPTLHGLAVCLTLLMLSIQAARGAANLEVLRDFVGHGRIPSAGLIADAEGNLYGVTEEGGALDQGVLFKASPTGEVTILHYFKHEFPFLTGNVFGLKSRLCLGSDGWLYGTAQRTGSGAEGTLFRISKTGEYQRLHNFTGDDGFVPEGGVVEGDPGDFFGTTRYGGANGWGVIYRFNVASGVTVIHNFTSNLSTAVGGLVRGNDGKLYGGTDGLGGLFRISTTGEYETLHSFAFDQNHPFGFPNGCEITASLMVASDGNFYGVTKSGGDFNGGTIFSMSPTGTIAPVYHFPSGTRAVGALVEGEDGWLYGTREYSGPGHLFRVSKQGVYQAIHEFSSPGGTSPNASMVFVGGALFGTTSSGGAVGTGTLFKYSAANLYETLHSFGVGEPYGFPSALHLAHDGKLYGTVENGGSNAIGAILRVTPGGPVEVAHHFQVEQSASPPRKSRHGVAMGLDGAFYCSNYYSNGRSSISKVTSEGAEATTWFSFDWLGYRKTPFARGVDGRLYTSFASDSRRSIFRMEESGSLTAIHTISGPLNYRYNGLLFSGADGTLYEKFWSSLSRLTSNGEYQSLSAPPLDGQEQHFSALCESSDGSLYGFVSQGFPGHAKKFFRIPPKGSAKVIWEYADTESPAVWTLTAAPDGNFYGSTQTGLVRVSSVGEVTQIHPFAGSVPPELTLAGDGNLYGASGAGGPGGSGQLFRLVVSPSAPITNSSFTTAIAGEDGQYYGKLQIQVTRGGQFTGTLVIGGVTQRIKGKLDRNGNFVTQISRNRARHHISLRLGLDVDATPPVLNVGLHEELPGSAKKHYKALPVAGRTNALPSGITSGRKTLRFAIPQGDELPQGYGWASVSVKRSGAVLVSGKLGDGSPFSSGFGVQRNGKGLLQVAFPHDAGQFFGLLDFASAGGSDPIGEMTWRKAAQSRGTYRSGFETVTAAYLASYARPQKGQSALAYTEPVLDASFSGGGISPASVALNVSSDDKVTSALPNELNPQLSIDRASGRFSGSLQPAGFETPIRFTGVLDQSAQGGFGVFVNGENSGTVRLVPR